MTAAETAGPQGFIPQIDISGLYSTDPADKARVAAEIGGACRGVGFFFAVNHRVPAVVIEAARDKAAEFFDLPMAEKQQVKCDRNNRGYREMGDAVHKSGKLFARDSYDLDFPVAADDPEILAGTPLYAPNQWPALPGFEAALSAYYAGCLEAGLKILEGFALTLGQDDSGGLEVMGADGEWFAAPPVPGSFVVNVGELMKRWTNGRLKATVHRATHLKDAARFSMPLFCNPDFRTVVDPRQLGISDSEAAYPPVLSGDFLVSRFQATRKLWGAARVAGTEVAIEMASDW